MRDAAKSYFIPSTSTLQHCVGVYKRAISKISGLDNDILDYNIFNNLYISETYILY